jgi:hypothetical protein
MINASAIANARVEGVADENRLRLPLLRRSRHEAPFFAAAAYDYVRTFTHQVFRIYKEQKRYSCPSLAAPRAILSPLRHAARSPAMPADAREAMRRAAQCRRYAAHMRERSR